MSPSLPRSLLVPVLLAGLLTLAAPCRDALAAAPASGARPMRLEAGESRQGLLYFKPVSVDASAVRAAAAPGALLSLPDPDGGELVFRGLDYADHGDGVGTWVGRAEGAPAGQEAVITVGPGGAAFGRIPRADGSVLQLETVGGRTRLMEDQGLLIGRPSEPQVDDAMRPRLTDLMEAERRLAGAREDPPRAAAAPQDPVVQADPIYVDVMLAYTPGLAAYVGSDAATRTLLQNRIDVGNQALANGQVSARFRLVATERVDFTDEGGNSGVLSDITYWRDSDAHPMSLRLATLRHRHGADIVGLVRRYFNATSGSCGNGWIGGYLGNNIAFSVDYGYFVASHGTDNGFFCSDRTIGHEIGHNLGQNHDIETNNGDRDGAHSYSHGYRVTPPGENGFYTVMAYRKDNQTPALTFSNPAVVRADCADQACGLADANVAGSLNLTMPVVAEWQRPVDADDRYMATSRGHLDIDYSGLPALTDARWRVQTTSGTAFTVTGPTTAPAGAAFQVRLAWDGWSSASSVATVIAESSPGVVVSTRNITVGRREFVPEALALADNVPAPLSLAGSRDESRLHFTVPAHATEFRVRLTSAVDMDLYAAPAGVPEAASPLIGPGIARSLPAASNTGSALTKELVIPNNSASARRWMITVSRPGGSTLTYQPASVTAWVSAHTAAPAFRSGQYYNPSRSGHGLFVDFAGDQWVAVWYTYLQDGTPAWYYAQAAAPGSHGLWSAPLYRVGWNGNATVATAVGDIMVTPTGPTSMVFSYNLDGESGSEPMARLGGTGCPSSGGAPLDASGHWYSPSLSGFGYSAQYEPDQEIYIAYRYDRLGLPRWLIGAKAWDEAVTTVPLEQISGSCALCGLRATTSQLTGTLTRQIGVNGDGKRGLTQVGVNAPLLAPLAGTWAQSRATALLSARKGCQ